ARQMHHCSLVRSVHHSVNNAHAAAVYTGLTGHDRGEIGGGTRPTDHPAIGSVLGLLRPPRRPVVPFVSMPYITQEGAGRPPPPARGGGGRPAAAGVLRRAAGANPRPALRPPRPQRGLLRPS